MEYIQLIIKENRTFVKDGFEIFVSIHIHSIWYHMPAFAGTWEMPCLIEIYQMVFRFRCLFNRRRIKDGAFAAVFLVKFHADIGRHVNKTAVF